MSTFLLTTAVSVILHFNNIVCFYRYLLHKTNTH